MGAKRKELAIKGHPTRGSEVIALLQMLGGHATIGNDGDNRHAYYLIDANGKIYYKFFLENLDKYKIFTLEEFEEKYPYKVRDKVNFPCKECVKTITSMDWDGILNTVRYKLDNKIYTNIDQLKVVNDLQPYKEKKHFKKLLMKVLIKQIKSSLKLKPIVVILQNP